ncbi:hypothetical protein MMC28_005365 [Mycoblastus sanguinarius]|nr:hypothetical protein [Mycoblastus sanguinarius]
MYWCCLKPMFSNGGGVTFVGPGMTGSVTNHIRTAPLPRGEGYEDPEFARISTEVGTSSTAQDDHHPTGDQTRHGPDDQILNWLLFGPGSQDQNPCPRSLCQQCWERPGWRAACLVCKEPFCFAHDLRGLNMRICGYKDLAVEKAQLEEGISKFRAIVEAWDNSDKAQNMTLTELDKTFLGYFTDLAASLGSLGKLRDILKLIKLPETIGPEVWKEIEDLTLRQRSGQILLRPLDHSQSTTPCPSGGDTQASQMDSSIEIPWRGCGSFMCPQYRSIGDHRPKCTAAARQCALCDVHVCPECLALKPACDCSYCKDNYHCPNCFHRLEHLCKKTEEEEEKLKIAKEIELKKAAAMYKKRMADQMADQVGEFLAFVLGENEEPGDGSR